MNLEEKWKAERERKAFLALADGTVFHGVAFGARRDTLGEVVFNTGMCGYQEIVTDPSYAGQFVALTAAEIGNYGINGDDVESRGLFLSGLVVNDLTAPSNWRSEKSLDEYLAANGMPGIYGVDVRALTQHIRDHGSQKAFLCVSARRRRDREGSRMGRTRRTGLRGKSDVREGLRIPAPSRVRDERRSERQAAHRLLRFRREDKHSSLASVMGKGDGSSSKDASRRRACDEARRRVSLKRPRRPRGCYLRHREH